MIKREERTRNIVNRDSGDYKDNIIKVKFSHASPEFFIKGIQDSTMTEAQKYYSARINQRKYQARNYERHFRI